jgi:hypothetical protein
MSLARVKFLLDVFCIELNRWEVDTGREDLGCNIKTYFTSFKKTFLPVPSLALF